MSGDASAHLVRATLVQTIDQRPAPPVEAWLHRLMWSPAWDLFVRLANLAWIGWMMLGQIVGLSKIFATQTEHGTPLFITAVAARLAVIMFLSLLMVAVVGRGRPVAKTQGVWSRIAALGGTFIPSFVFVLPRNDEVLLINLVSFTLFAVGFGLTVYALTHLNRSFSIMPEARRLVTGGPYRFVRHPVYLFEQIGIVGLFLPYLYSSVWAALMLAAQFFCQFQRMSSEECVLQQTFPDYGEYARRTARLVPGIY